MDFLTNSWWLLFNEQSLLNFFEGNSWLLIVSIQLITDVLRSVIRDVESGWNSVHAEKERTIYNALKNTSTQQIWTKEDCQRSKNKEQEKAPR